jgi:hypothetical protein
MKETKCTSEIIQSKFKIYFFFGRKIFFKFLESTKDFSFSIQKTQSCVSISILKREHFILALLFAQNFYKVKMQMKSKGKLTKNFLFLNIAN